MSVRSFFGDKINPPKFPDAERLIYSIDDIIKVKGLRIENSLGADNQVLTATGLGNARWRDAPIGPKGDTGDTGPQGEKGDTGDTGPQGEKGDQGFDPNYAFLIKEQTTDTIFGSTPGVTGVAADSSNIPGVGFVSWDDEDKLFTYSRVQSSPTNKFNFYTHSIDGSRGVNINGLTIGRLASLMCDFTCVDIISGLPRPQVSFFFAVYTVPKFDGTDRATWYNSRIVIAESNTVARIETGVNYLFDPSHFLAGSTLLSTSYSSFDVIGAINIGSSSSEPQVGWVFTLENLRVFYAGPTGNTGPAGDAYSVINEDASKALNYWTARNDVTPGFAFNLPSPSIVFEGRRVFVWNDSAVPINVVAGTGEIRNIYAGDINIYSSVGIVPQKMASFVCLKDGFNNYKWCASDFSPGTSFNP